MRARRLARRTPARWGLGLAAILWIGSSGPSHGQVDAARTAAALKPAQGLEAALWAAEPLLVNPTNIDIDSRGRVWVAEGLNYRLSRGGNRRFHKIEEADRIRILEDTDGDGKADKSTVFADRIFPVPMGIAVEEHHDATGKYTGCRVFVGNSPDLLVLEDTDGDDKADKRYALLSGFGGVDSDHGVHGMTLGLDGKLYFTHGDGCCSVQQDHSERQQNFDVVDRSGRRVSTDQLANTLRVNRDGTQFEIICDRQRNNYETSLNAFGEIFTSDNDDDGNRGCRVIQALDGGHFGYRTPGSPRHWGEDVPGNVPKLVGTGNGSPCGIMVYEGALLPPEYRGAILEVDAGSRQVNFIPITRENGSYRAEYKVFLSGSDPWFRPVDACAAPDGSIYVADWYDAGVGGHAFSDQTTGRIYRVAPKGVKVEQPRPDFGSLAGLLAALRSPNVATQDAARRGLIAIARTQPAAESLKEMAYHDPDPIIRARALWVASAIEGPVVAVPLLNVALSGNEPRIRAQVVRMLARDCAHNGHVVEPKGAKPKTPEPWVFDALKAAANDPDAQVRREVILALRNRPTAEVGDTLRTLAASWDGHDRWYLEALGLALEGRESDYLARLLDGSLFGAIDFETQAAAGDVALPPYFPVDRNEAFLSPGAAVLPVTNLSKMLGLCWRLHRPESLGFLEASLPKLRAIELEQAALDVLGRISDARAAKTVAALAGKARDPEQARACCSLLIRGLARDWSAARKSSEVAALVERMLGDASTRVDGISLAAATGDDRLRAQVEHFAEDPAVDPASRLAAIQTLGSGGGHARAILTRLVEQSKGQSSSTPESEAAVRTLGRVRDSGGKLFDLARSKDYPLGVRRQALRAAAEQRDGAWKLLELARTKTLPDDLKPEAADLLLSSVDRGLRSEAAKVFPPPKAAGGRALPPPAVLARRQGDAERGKLVFFRDSAEACARCHRVQGRGQWVGPDLSTIGVKYGRQELYHSILNPSAAVGYNYRAVVVALTDGRAVTGLTVEDAPERLVLKTAQGERIEIPRSDIEDRKTSDISLMPEGLAASLSERELVDLVEYLATLKQPVSVLGRCQAAGPLTEAEARALLEPGHPSESKAALRRIVADAEGRIDLSRLRGGQADRGAYLTSPLVSTVVQDARIVLEAQGPIAAWLDGKRLELKSETDHGPHAVSAQVKLPQGGSRLVVKLGGGVSGTQEGRIVITVISERSISFEESGAGVKTAAP